MSVWNPEPGDPWYDEPTDKELLDREKWSNTLCELAGYVLVVLALFAVVGVVAFFLGYHHVF